MPQLKTINMNLFLAFCFYHHCFSPSTLAPSAGGHTHLFAIVSDWGQDGPEGLEAHGDVQQVSSEEEVIKVSKNRHGGVPDQIQEVLQQEDQKKKKKNSSSGEIIFINIKIQTFRFLMDTEKMPIRKQWLIKVKC